MRRLLIAIALIAFAGSAALAGSISITVVGVHGTTTVNYANVPNAQVSRFIAAYGVALGQVKVDPACVDAPGAVPPVVCVFRDRTPPEIIRGWANGIVQGTMNNVTRHERSAAERTAHDAVAPVEIPPQ